MNTDDKTNASRQARYRAKQAEKGFTRYTVWINHDDMQEGREHGSKGLKTFPVPKGKDELSWVIGSTYGQIDRRGMNSAKEETRQPERMPNYTPGRQARRMNQVSGNSESIPTIPNNQRNRNRA